MNREIELSTARRMEREMALQAEQAKMKRLEMERESRKCDREE